MTLTHAHVRSVLDVYARAWTTQDPALITTIFTESATYHERVLGEAMRGRAGIRTYWVEKIVKSQANIECDVLNVYVDGATAVAEWEARFDDLVQGVRKRMREVAILDFEGPLIARLREYWTSEVIRPLDGRAPAGR